MRQFKKLFARSSSSSFNVECEKNKYETKVSTLPETSLDANCEKNKCETKNLNLSIIYQLKG